ncbi:AbrB/MazE/SpoVT family DNA-binding domain-containing protein [Candidatus Parcubacteria bacterium]|nr:AbrB/MazE/SpoVT family DNA-binding domain-containing protein [Candidatus Parcubacteria bacterium]
MKKYTSDNIRKLTRTGRVSYTVVIPKEMVKKLKWQERQKLQLKLRGKSVVVKDAK